MAVAKSSLVDQAKLLASPEVSLEKKGEYIDELITILKDKMSKEINERDRKEYTEPIFTPSQLKTLKETLIKVGIFIRDLNRYKRKVEMLSLLQVVFKRELKQQHPDINFTDLQDVSKKLDAKLSQK